MSTLKQGLFISILFVSAASAQTIIYEQPHDLTSTLRQSSWWEPDDSDYDIWIWDSFTLASPQTITEIRWRGGYIYNGQYSGSITGFTVAIYPSIAAGTEPDVVHPPLVNYYVAGNANETFAGGFGGKSMYDYRYVLPSPFPAAAGTKYWIQIEAWQSGLPEWALASGSGGNGGHFRFVRGLHMYQAAPGDVAFSLRAAGGATFNIAASSLPANSGTIIGAGQYPAGSTASLTANSNAGFAFSNWTENGTQVSSNSTYAFIVNSNRTLVANFLPSYTISTVAAPTSAGSTSGGGVFAAGALVTVSATANQGFVFGDWSEFGTPVSYSPVYTFTASANRNLAAIFVTDPNTLTFDFDNGPVHVSLPIDLTVDGLTAHFSVTGSGFSIQPANTMGFTPAGFAGNCIYPNSVFQADLVVDFSQPLSYFSILYAPQELGCDDSATMRATVFMDGLQVGTNTTTAPTPGTWPTGTLTITQPSGFNRVVVHYDHRPPTCQDWGPIFLADNMIVTRVCNAVSIIQQPVSAAVCQLSQASFLADASGTTPISYVWSHDGLPIDTAINPTAAAPLLVISSAALSDAGLYTCEIFNVCGSAATNAATLVVWDSGTGDANNDGFANGADIQQFVTFVLHPIPPNQAWCAVDFNADGQLDATDIQAFVNKLLGV